MLPNQALRKNGQMQQMSNENERDLLRENIEEWSTNAGKGKGGEDSNSDTLGKNPAFHRIGQT